MRRAGSKLPSRRWMPRSAGAFPSDLEATPRANHPINSMWIIRPFIAFADGLSFVLRFQPLCLGDFLSCLRACWESTTGMPKTMFSLQLL